MRVKLIKIIVCTFFVFFCNTNAFANEPDEISILGPQNGVYTVTAKWGAKEYGIQLKGELTELKNKQLLRSWILKTAKKHENNE